MSSILQLLPSVRRAAILRTNRSPRAHRRPRRRTPDGSGSTAECVLLPECCYSRFAGRARLTGRYSPQSRMSIRRRPRWEVLLAGQHLPDVDDTPNFESFLRHLRPAGEVRRADEQHLHRIPRLLVVDFRIVAGDNALLLQLLDSVVDGRPGYVRLLRDVRVGGSASVYLQQMQNAAVEVVEWVIARDGLFVAESVSHSPSTRSRSSPSKTLQISIRRRRS